MDHKLLALKLYKASGDASLAGDSASVSPQDLLITILLKFVDVLEGSAIIIAGFILVRFLKRYFQKIETTHERQRTALNLLEKITNGFVVIMDITLGLKIIGLDLTLIISVLTLGLSFGLRDVIKNYIAGILILFKSPFEIGDTVKIRSFTGKVIKIEFQAITVKTFDNKEITIHNKDILTQPITNFSKGEQRRLEIDLKLGYGSDLQRALAITSRILDNEPNVLKTPKYTILFKSFETVGTQLTARFWVAKTSNFLGVRSDLALKIQEAFDEEKLFAPYSREAGLREDGLFAMTESRKERLAAFYNQSVLADLALKTFARVGAAVTDGTAVAADGAAGAAANAGAAGGNGNGINAIVETAQYADLDEPE